MHFLETIAAVLVGGLLTFISTYLADRRRDRRDEQRARRLELLDLRQAARMTRDELLDAVFEIEDTRQRRIWPKDPLAVESWRLHAPTLARGLSFEDWNTVAIAYGHVVAFNSELRSAANLNRPVLTEEEAANLFEIAIEHIDQAEELLVYAGGDDEDLARTRAALAREETGPDADA